MIQDEIPISTQAIQWKCIESRMESKRLHYGCLVIPPPKRGQVNTVGIAMCRALPGEVEGTSITHAKSEGMKHEYSTITGIRETIHDISVNLKEIVPQSDSNDVQKAFPSIHGPKKVTAGDISFPPSVKAIDESQHIATTTQSMSVNVESKIGRGRGYCVQDPKLCEAGEFPIDAVSMSVRNVNHSIHLFGNGREIQEIPFMEIWTNGGLTPNEAPCEASRNSTNLFIPFPHMGENNTSSTGGGEDSSNPTDFSYPPNDMDESTREFVLKHTFIDQLELPVKTYNCLKRVGIRTIWDPLNYSQEDLEKIKNFGRKSVDQVLKTLWERFDIELPKNKSYVDWKKEG
uniref:DNA-directed RNA polymerase n=1 Tax=Dipteris conjugata TaxID=32108 RepID=A0A385GPC1_9MONI|nr:RNA polymerase alpha subunit [Dipteris conjugata]